METTIERTVLGHLVHDEAYSRYVLPHIKSDYFNSEPEKLTFKLVEEYSIKYNALPTKEALLIDLKNTVGIPEKLYQDTRVLIDGLARDAMTDRKWLIDKTEKFCRDRALYNALIEASVILEDKSGKAMPDSIPDLLSDALAVGFDNRVGHDYLEDFNSRFEFYHRREERISLGLEKFDDITKGGVARKTLTVILAGTGVGKTLMMCNFAATHLMDGKNVLYITMEMAEEKIAERIDANLLNVRVDDLASLTQEAYEDKVKRVREKTLGKLIIKEYPTASAHAGHFRALLKELKIKKNFTPDVIFIDYLAICASSRIKPGAGANSYTLVKSIAEELRGLAGEYNVPVITAAQVTRTGMGSSDVDLTDTSESIGLPFTADLMFAVIATEELDRLGQLMVKQLKNRYDDMARMRRFVIGVDKPKMRLFDADPSAQSNLMQDSPKPSSAPIPEPSVSDDLKRRLKRLV